MFSLKIPVAVWEADRKPLCRGLWSYPQCRVTLAHGVWSSPGQRKRLRDYSDDWGTELFARMLTRSWCSDSIGEIQRPRKLLIDGSGRRVGVEMLSRSALPLRVTRPPILKSDTEGISLSGGRVVSHPACIRLMGE